MKKRISKFFICILLSAVLLSTAFSAFVSGESCKDYSKYYNGILNWVGKDVICSNTGTSPIDWYVIAANRAGINLVGAKENLQSVIKKTYENGGFSKATDGQRISLAFAAVGGNVTDILQDGNINLASDTVYNNSKLLKSGINTLAFGLILLDSVDIKVPSNATYNRNDIISEILNRQLKNGGFTLTGPLPDPDVTAIVITALAPYYNKRDDVAIAVEKALEILSSAQQSDGGYKSYGILNCESTAQVITALTSLGIDPLKDSRFIKNGETTVSALLKYCNNDGGFAHIYGGKSDGFSSSQAMCALVSLNRFYNNKSPIYDYSGSKAAVYKKKEMTSNISGAESTSSSSTAFESSKTGSLASSRPESEFITSSNEVDITESSVTDDTTVNVETEDKVINGTNNKLDFEKIIIIVIVILIFNALMAIIILYKKGNKLTGKYCSLAFGLVAILLVILIILSSVTIQTKNEFYYSSSFINQNNQKSVVISIDCKVLLENQEKIPQNIRNYIPKNCIILNETEVQLQDNDSVFDILFKVCKNNNIQLEYSGSNSKYIQGIGYLYEFACGDLSGWMYSVNGISAKKSCSDYFPASGDVIKWEYTINLGTDIQNNY